MSSAVARAEHARGRAEAIRSLLADLVAGRDRVLELITAARDAGDAEELGYSSWTAYVAAEFGSLLPKLQRDERVPLASRMRALGMSTRTIAPVVGVSKSQVDRDLATVPNGTVATVTSRDGRQRPATRPPTPAMADHLRRRAAWQPFRALMSSTMQTLVDGVDDLIAGHAWEDLDDIHARHGIDSRDVVLGRVRALGVAADRLLAAWEHQPGANLRRIK